MDQMMDIKGLIIGAGSTGMDLFKTVLNEPGFVLTGIVDTKNEFSSFDIACNRNIPVFNDLSCAMQTLPDIIFYLAESEIALEEVLAYKPDQAEIIENQGIRFFLNTIHRSRINTLHKIHEGMDAPSDIPTAEGDLPHIQASAVASDAIHETSGSGEGKIAHILCIDGDKEYQQSLCDILESAEYRVSVAQKGMEGMGKVLNDRPDLIIFDPVTVDKEGFPLLQALKSKTGTADIPIIIITAKNMSVGERLKYAGNIESAMHKNFFVRDDLLTHIQALEISRLRCVGLLDEVSGLFNKPYFQIRLAQEISRADRHKTIFSILMASIDGFQDYIQVCGIEQYNGCVRKIGYFLRETSRGSDVLARYGMDGFAMLLNNTNAEDTEVVARRLASFVEGYPFPGIAQIKEGKLTVSIGTVYYDFIGPCVPERMILEAQNLMRESAKSGGGKIKVYGLNRPKQTHNNFDLVFDQSPSVPG